MRQHASLSMLLLISCSVFACKARRAPESVVQDLSVDAAHGGVSQFWIDGDQAYRGYCAKGMAESSGLCRHEAMLKTQRSMAVTTLRSMLVDWVKDHPPRFAAAAAETRQRLTQLAETKATSATEQAIHDQATAAQSRLQGDGPSDAEFLIDTLLWSMRTPLPMTIQEVGDVFGLEFDDPRVADRIGTFIQGAFSLLLPTGLEGHDFQCVEGQSADEVALVVNRGDAAPDLIEAIKACLQFSMGVPHVRTNESQTEGCIDPTVWSAVQPWLASRAGGVAVPVRLVLPLASAAEEYRFLRLGSGSRPDCGTVSGIPGSVPVVALCSVVKKVGRHTPKGPCGKDAPKI